MTKCKYYEPGVQHKESNEIRSSQMAAYITTKAPWCDHDPSAATHEQVTKFIDCELRCGGVIENCALPKDVRPVVNEA